MQGNAVPTPPIFGSKRSPTSYCHNARERHTTTDKGLKLECSIRPPLILHFNHWANRPLTYLCEKIPLIDSTLTYLYSRNEGPSSGVLTPESSLYAWLAMVAALGGVTLELHAELYELNDEPYEPARFLRDCISSTNNCLLWLGDNLMRSGIAAMIWLASVIIWLLGPTSSRSTSHTYIIITLTDASHSCHKKIHYIDKTALSLIIVYRPSLSSFMPENAYPHILGSFNSYKRSQISLRCCYIQWTTSAWFECMLEHYVPNCI